jgi:hypothetical protein
MSLSAVPATLQAAHAVLTSFGPALRLLAHSDEPLNLPRNANLKAPAFGDPELIFAAFLALRDVQGAGGVLSALEKSIRPAMGVSDRSVLINQIGSEIEEVYKKRRKK